LNVGEGVSRAAALKSLVEGLEDDAVLSGKTSLMITPNSYEFKVVDHLMTNFHAPDSTLMLLVSAFLGGGDKVKFVYETAQRKGYRFLSYGDVCLFSRPGAPPLHSVDQNNVDNSN
jgi:S-adenosylmethionine:tRNA ribosyltransferase-isomerase